MKGNFIRITNLLTKKRFWLVERIYIQNEFKNFLFFKFLKKRSWQDFMSDSFCLINPQTMRNCKKTHSTMTFDLDSRWEDSEFSSIKGTLVQPSVDLLFLRLFKRFFKLGLGVGLGLGLGLGIVLGLRLGTRLALGLRVGWVLCITTQSYSN